MASAELFMIKGVIASLPDADRDLVNECAEKLRAIIKEYGDQGMCAIALVAIEMNNG